MNAAEVKRQSTMRTKGGTAVQHLSNISAGTNGIKMQQSTTTTNDENNNDATNTYRVLVYYYGENKADWEPQQRTAASKAR